MFDNNILIQDLSSRALETIPDIKRAKVLQSLNLSNNKIVEVDKINDLINLRLLNISNNLLVDLLGLTSLKKLESLNVSKNKLTKFPSEISSKLKKLNLSENNICDLTNLNKLILLESIDLSFNSIVAESFDPSTFLSLNNLKFIDLTGNRITRVDSLSKSIPRGIEALFLNKNHILDLTSLYHLSVFTKLKALGISDNPCSNNVSPHHLHAYLIFLIPSLLVIDFQQINEDIKSSALKSFRDPRTFEIDQDIAIIISQGKEKELVDKLRKIDVGPRNSKSTPNPGVKLENLSQTYLTAEGDENVYSNINKPIASPNTYPKPKIKSLGSAIKNKVLTSKEKVSDDDETKGLKLHSQTTSIKNNDIRRLNDLLITPILNWNAKKVNILICRITAFQAIWRGNRVKRAFMTFRNVTAAALKIQSAFRRYQVIKWMVRRKFDKTKEDYKRQNESSQINSLDKLCGFYETDDPENTGNVSITNSIMSNEQKALNFSPNSAALVIKTMQLEIKRLQRLVERQGPIIPIDSP